jgi:hypothetical protein
MTLHSMRSLRPGAVRRHGSEFRQNLAYEGVNVANASRGPGDVVAGRTAVPIICSLGAVDDDSAMACRSFGCQLQSDYRLYSCRHRLARARYKQILQSCGSPRRMVRTTVRPLAASP